MVLELVCRYVAAPGRARYRALRQNTESVIPNQCAHWCGNPLKNLEIATACFANLAMTERGNFCESRWYRECPFALALQGLFYLG